MAVTSARQSEYRQAISSIRWAKNFLWLLAGLALLLCLGVFVAVQIKPSLAGVQRPAPAAEPPQTPAVVDGSDDVIVPTFTLVEPPGQAWARLRLALNIGMYVGLLSAMLLSLVVLLAVLVSLVGNTGGAGKLTSCFLWSLILLALLVPWQGVLGFWPAAGATYGMSELSQATARVVDGPVTTWQRICYYARFAAYPAAALVVWLIVQIKFAGGLGRMKVAPEIVSAPQPAPQPLPQVRPPAETSPAVKPFEPRPPDQRPPGEPPIPLE